MTTVASAPPVAIVRNGRIVASVRRAAMRVRALAIARVPRVAIVRARRAVTVRAPRVATGPGVLTVVRVATIREGPASLARAARASRREQCPWTTERRLGRSHRRGDVQRQE